jgi:transposase, IS30 family
MHKQYRHLSQRERGQIMFMSDFGLTVAQIATRLERDRATIYREMRRNKSPIMTHYSDECAQLHATHRRRQASHRYRLKDERIRTYVVEKLRIGWSPEIIAGRMKRDLPGTTISHEAIYQYAYHPDTAERNELISCLRRAHRRRRNRRSGRRSRNSRIPNRISISKRPSVVDERRQFGHWEGDSLVSSRNTTALCSLVERKSRFLRLVRIRRRGARGTYTAMVGQLGPLPESARRTLTLDNASEHVCHEKLTKTIGIRCYFCDPYSSWQRATNENTNGLIRWYFPKGTDFARLTEVEIKQVELALNSRPRKCLDFKTPLEVAGRFVALQP